MTEKVKCQKVSELSEANSEVLEGAPAEVKILHEFFHDSALIFQKMLSGLERLSFPGKSGFSSVSPTLFSSQCKCHD